MNRLQRAALWGVAVVGWVVFGPSARGPVAFGVPDPASGGFAQSGSGVIGSAAPGSGVAHPPPPTGAETPALRLARAAGAQVDGRSYYTPEYRRISYPNGDVPDGAGICADVVVRAYRRGLGLDLQKLVHEDMRANFAAYPSRRVWGLRRPDTNIDHRRVLNLNAFFRRKGTRLSAGDSASYRPGDIVSWNLRSRGFLPHIGVVAEERGPSGNFMVVHNIGNGPRREDVLFDWTILGHFRYP